MKAIKKIIKFLAVVGAVAGLCKLIYKALSMNQRMNDYNEKAVLTGKKIKYEEEPFEKDSVASMFSGMDLNFTKAKMAGDTSQLDILGRFAGITVKVPPTWHVEMDGTAVQSGISQRYVDNSEDEDAPVLQINYDLKYSGLDVANPKEEVIEEDEEVIEDVQEELVIEDVTEEVIDDIAEDDVEDISEMSDETKKVMEDFEENFAREDD